MFFEVDDPTAVLPSWEVLRRNGCPPRHDEPWAIERLLGDRPGAGSGRSQTRQRRSTRSRPASPSSFFILGGRAWWAAISLATRATVSSSCQSRTVTLRRLTVVSIQLWGRAETIG